ncbi:MAG: hypothetical protein KDK76_05190 [Chlamydiia bacterium]|nr:hypothetical protein [Chlamydiia bacterium]
MFSKNFFKENFKIAKTYPEGLHKKFLKKVSLAPPAYLSSTMMLASPTGCNPCKEIAAAAVQEVKIKYQENSDFGRGISLNMHLDAGSLKKARVVADKLYSPEAKVWIHITT